MLVASYNGSLSGFNTGIEKYKVAELTLNAQCANRTYLESDMQAVLAGK